MTIVYRMQEIGINFEDMIDFKSRNWTTDEELDGLAAALYPEDLQALAQIWYQKNYANQEVVIFNGVVLDDLGDGVLVDPCNEIDRISLDEFMEMSDFNEWEGAA